MRLKVGVRLESELNILSHFEIETFIFHQNVFKI